MSIFKKRKSLGCRNKTLQTWINPSFSCLRIDPDAVVITTLETWVGNNLGIRRRRLEVGYCDESIESRLSCD